MSRQDNATNSNGGQVVVGGILYGMGAITWLTVVPRGIIIATATRSSDAVTNGIFTAVGVVFAVLCGVGTAMVAGRLGRESRTTKVVTTALAILFVIALAVRIWLGFLEELPSIRCDIPPC